MLTDTAIRKAGIRPTAYRMADARGLYLQVTPAGGKLWRYKYRHSGREKLMALGQYPDVSLLDARARHADARRILATGVDPMEQRKQERVATLSADARSFRTVALAWHEQWKRNKTEKYAATMLYRLETNVLPAIGHLGIEQIEAPDLVAIVKRVEDRGALDVARRALQTCGQVFRYAIAHSYCRRNPASDIRPADILQPYTTVNVPRIDAASLPKLLNDIDSYRGQAVTMLALRFMALTFVRTRELIGAEWAEIDLEAARWDIPAERMKMRTPHIVPLSRQALEVLRALKLITGTRRLVFPGDVDPNQPMSNNTLLFALYRMGYKGEMTGHGFRGVAATVLNEHGFDESHVDLQLAHIRRNKVSAAYNHAKYLKPRTEMMQWWADYLDEQRRRLAIPNPS